MASADTLAISELFASLQGESTYAGLPCVFIRLAGCNLRCSYCDSRYAIEEKGRDTALADILAFVAAYPGFLVEITGGEPLLQPHILPLIESLLAQRRTVLVETNGSLDIAPLPAAATVIMDIKCPGSGATSLHPDNIGTVKTRASQRAGSTEIKFVLTDLNDYAWAKEMVRKHGLTTFAPVLFSPVSERLPVRVLAEAIVCDRLPVRLQLQLHRIIWPDVARGV